ncbi:MAG: DoxX family protein [Xanthomonadales bacterium]|nr:DoxX family protein [Xanthomonadales bacterium]
MVARLRDAGDYTWPLLLRLILAFEFAEAGLTKLRGENWFGEIPWEPWQKGFPFPFDRLSTDMNWLLATWGELAFASLLALGLFTRFAAVSLLVITVVATAAVHWPAEWSSLGELWSGYVITSQGEGNYKLPLLFVVMLLPLIFHGGGKLSMDHGLLILTGRTGLLDDRTAGLQSLGLAFIVLGLATVWVEPSWGIPLFIAGIVAIVVPEFSSKK